MDLSTKSSLPVPDLTVAEAWPPTVMVLPRFPAVIAAFVLEAPVKLIWSEPLPALMVVVLPLVELLFALIEMVLLPSPTEMVPRIRPLAVTVEPPLPRVICASTKLLILTLPLVGELIVTSLIPPQAPLLVIVRSLFRSSATVTVTVEPTPEIPSWPAV